MTAMLRRSCVPFLVLISGALCTPVFAQAKKAGPEEPAPRSYVLPYAVTILGLAGGLIAVCMPSARKADVPVDEE